MAAILRRLAAFAAALLLSAPALAAPISSYPNATAPLAGTEQMLSTQGGSTVNVLPSQVASYSFGLVTNDCTITSLGVITCTKSNGTAFGTAAFQNTGTSGATLPFLNGANTWSGNNTFGNTNLIVSGTSTGHITISTLYGSTSNFTLNLPAANDTLAAINTQNNWGVKQLWFTSTTGSASINIPQGVTPTTPVNGDIWTTSSGLFVQIAGATVGPLSAASGANPCSTTAGAVQFEASSTTFGCGPEIDTTTTSQFTASALATPAAGQLGVAGGSTTDPTLAANDEGAVYLSTTGGLSLIGQGSTTDFILKNKSKSTICSVATGTVNLTCAGSIAPSTTGGIIGTTAADNANAGSVGELISSSIVRASGVALTSNTAANITSVSLTAGDWDCRATAAFTFPTTLSQIIGVMTTTSATVPVSHAAVATGAEQILTFTMTPQGDDNSMAIGPFRENVSSTTTLFLVANSTFTGSSNAYGFLGCRRVR